MYRVGPKTPRFPPSGDVLSILWLHCHAPKHQYLLGFCHVGTPEAPQEVNLESKLGPEVAPCTQFLKPNDARKGYREPTISNRTPLPSHKVPKIMRTKTKKAPMCSVSLIAIELKGLAAPGEALKIGFGSVRDHSHSVRRRGRKCSRCPERPGLSHRQARVHDLNVAELHRVCMEHVYRTQQRGTCAEGHVMQRQPLRMAGQSLSGTWCFKTQLLQP